MSPRRLTPDEAAAFPWFRVRRGPGCWEWIGARTGSNYGHYKRAKDVLAHRAAWEEAFGPIPVGLQVLHHCDNPPCVKTEPDEKFPTGHLYLGDRFTNMHDASVRGRCATGDRNGSKTKPERVLRGTQRKLAKLTEDDIQPIRDLLRVGMTQREIAERFGVTQMVISRIALRRGWVHVPEREW